VEKHFRWLVTILCCGYLAIQIRYITALPLVMDEFNHAAIVSRLLEEVPYRDYAPYKTVLGLYLLLPPVLAFESVWAAMLAAKLEIACLTTFVLWAVAQRLRRCLAPTAILASLLLLCTQSTFLERASELRVDMLAALMGLISLTAFLERRSLLAGATAAGAVLMTQKGAYFVLSLAGASLFQLVYCRSRQHVREILATAAAGTGVVLSYVAFWCVVGDPSNVWQGMVVGPKSIAFDPLYRSLDTFWMQTLLRNPVFYGVGWAGLVLLIPRWNNRDDTVGGRLWAYSLILVVLCAWHKQPWPYFFVLLIPTAWVVSAVVLDERLRGPRWWTAALGVFVAGGACVSLAQRMPVVLQRSSTDQRAIISAASAFLQPGETYLDGSQLVWRRPHITQLVWLDMPRLAELRRAPDAALREIQTDPPRLLIDNYRLRNLPPKLLDELHGSFLPVGGNLFTYAPPLPVGASSQHFAYGGLYLVRAPGGGRVSLDGRPWLGHGDTIRLDSGMHRMDLVGDARLVSWSDEPAFLEQTRRPSVALFDRVYDY
jgi:hypothetical protein